MKKISLFILMLLAVSLAGCLPQATASPTLAPTSTIPVRLSPTTPATLAIGSELLPDSGCTVITKKPTPGPTAESIYPPVTEADHAKGPADARVTIIEYSDFQ